ncbi:MAG TPA: 50S ribosomal protein L17 [Phycisphaerales bacterium]|nr:50S ribosomal protein L17 [Phycisphaerales bacterium]HCD32358.1 50S ribosomal protein L17 [Phycisphaerales bacterium]|tara:strand:+ start:827 stop:1423 length:597 start_codon:yes stop_codon:yes gene_type:complete
MRHKVGGFKLGRDTEHRKAMWRNMAIALLTHGQITTTVPKAKSLKPFVEKLISLAKKGDLASRRRVLQQIGNPIMVKFDEDPDVSRNKYGELVDGPKLVKRMFDVLGPQFADRNGGYTRIVRLGKHRIGDASDLCVIQLVGDESGPQVSGQYSRRRDKANKRMEFAAKLRKGAKAEAATAVAEAPEAPDTEAPEKTEE